jgi:superfamily II DNA or RNA helicase
MKKPKIILNGQVCIPVKTIDVDSALEMYTRHEYDEMTCRKCEYKRDRHSEVCDSCEFGGYLGAYKLADRVDIKGVPYVAFPIGDRRNIAHNLGIDFKDYKIVDKRTKVEFDYPVKFTGELRDYQMPMFKIFVKKKFGVIQAPPRTGKTVTSLAMLIELGYRVVIIADQTDFLDNFITEIEAYTNLPELQLNAGKKLYGYPKKDIDFETLQICVMTYQSLISETAGKKRLDLVNENFGSVFVDEVHSAAALEYSKVLNKITAHVKGGCTATYDRKDNKQYRVGMIIGPVISSVTAVQLQPKVTVHVTRARPKKAGMYTRGPAAWTHMNSFLSKHKDRNAQLLKAIKHDLKKGRSLVIATYFKHHVQFLVDEVNEMMGEQIAYAFVGGNKKVKDERKWILQQARENKIRVVIGIRRLLQRGLNVPRWDCLYYAMPMNNAPNWEQESRRICTPDEGKQMPLIRMFVDPELKMALGCFKGTVKQSIALGYKITKKSMETAIMLGVNSNEFSSRDDDTGMYDDENRARKAKHAAAKNKYGSLLDKILDDKGGFCSL